MSLPAQIAVGLFLLLGNVVSLVAWGWGLPIGTGWPYVSLALCIYVCIAVTYRPDVTASLRWLGHGLRLRRAGAALGIGVVSTVPALLFLLDPGIVGTVGDRELAGLSGPELAVRVLVYGPLVTALSEELLFRQFILDRQRVRGLVGTLATNGLLFTAWHLVVLLRTVLQTNLAYGILPLLGAYLGGLASLFVGGVVLCLVRLRLGSCVYSALTHATIDAVLTVAAWLA